jgi:hypothetical protein
VRPDLQQDKVLTQKRNGANLMQFVDLVEQRLPRKRGIEEATQDLHARAKPPTNSSVAPSHQPTNSDRKVTIIPKNVVMTTQRMWMPMPRPP